MSTCLNEIMCGVALLSALCVSHAQLSSTAPLFSRIVEKGDNLSVAFIEKTDLSTDDVAHGFCGRSDWQDRHDARENGGFWDEEIEAMLDALASVIAPLLIMFLEVIVGGIVIAMSLPIFKLNEVVTQSKS